MFILVECSHFAQAKKKKEDVLDERDVGEFFILHPEGARCSSMVRAFTHGVWVVRSILRGGPIELFLVPASAP